MTEPTTTTQPLAATMGVNATEWQRILDTLGRAPTYSELGVFSVMWSEHCSYKSSRIHLGRLPTQGPKVVQGPGENAGAVDIGDGYCAVFKMESHNHPSYIEPYQGAATGVGGILRDVFTMGARPVASLNSLRFGRVDHPKTRALVSGVVAGIGGYGNCIGVPTVGGEVQFDASYDGNILVNAFTVGIARTDQLFFGRADGIGNAVLYVGARTGRDGIHGATMASAEFDADSEKKLPTVQVGDPFMEKLLLEACLEIFASGCLEGVQDMGAAGLTSSSVEMAARAGNGLELDLDAIPRRTQNLTPYELLLSESQERMLMVAKPGRDHEVFAICKKWDLEAAIVGRVTNTGRFICKATPGFDPLSGTTRRDEPQVVVDIPVDALTDGAPKYDRPQTVPEPTRAAPAFDTPTDFAKELLTLLASANIGSRHKIYRQFDSIVGDGTVLGPAKGDAAVVRVFCGRDDKTQSPYLEKFLALSADCNGRQVELDAHQGAAMAVAECARNIVCSGGQPLGLTDCLNFGSPEKPDTMWRFARAVDGIRDACLALNVPVVSGNVSLYNETDGKPILPTPTVAIVGQIDKKEHITPSAWQREGDAVLLVGAASKGAMGGSEWLTQKAGYVCGTSAGIDLKLEGALQSTLLECIRQGLVSSAHDVSDGGLAVTLAECCIGSGIGAAITPPKSLTEIPTVGLLFGEDPSRVVLSCSEADAAAITARFSEVGVQAVRLGATGGHVLSIASVLSASVTDLAGAYCSALDGVL